jgi:hypothetical protein
MRISFTDKIFVELFKPPTDKEYNLGSVEVELDLISVRKIYLI